MSFSALMQSAYNVLNESDPARKASRTIQFCQENDVPNGVPNDVMDDVMPRSELIADVPMRPARPDAPVLLPPGQMPKRKSSSSVKGRIALLHALAHIELNAIDLAWDIMLRFAASEDMPAEFYHDWLGVAHDEARHYQMLANRLDEFDASYGDLPAHDGLWEAAETTAHDLLARLAIVPMVLEARGLDVTPAMISSLKKAGDLKSAEILTIIHDEEISHVSIGHKWFEYLCNKRQILSAKEKWQELVRTYFRGQLKRPFNTQSRTKADFPAGWYEPLVIEE